MTTKNANRGCLFGALAIAAAIWLALTGCESTPGGTTASSSNSRPSDAGKVKPNGAAVWAESCSRCHNLRSPRELSYDEWEVVVHHMRVRATLTAEETRAILEFLKAAN
jgi:hypothetical protein